MNVGVRFEEALLRDRRLQNWALCGLILTVGLVLTLVSERISVTHGLGFDGAEYGYWAMHFDKVLSREIPVSPYRMFRIFPSGLAYAALRLTGAAPVPENVIRFFQAYNLLLLGIAALAWGGIADASGLSARGKLLGFLGLFGNHAILKYNFYYPVLTDTSAYALALISLYAYLRNFLPLLATAAVVGAFCWPTLLVFDAILLLFPRRDHVVGKGGGWVCLLPACLATGTFLFLALRYQIQTPWYPLSVAVVAAYIFFGLWFLCEDPFFVQPRNMVRSLSISHLGLFALVVAVFILVRELATVKAGGGPYAHFNSSILTMIGAYIEGTCIPLSTRFPGEFIVAHVLYFGPLLLLTACFPHRTARVAGRFGFGFFLLSVVAWLHAIMPLSRQWIAGYPVLVLATVLALEKVPLGRAFFVWFTVLSLFLSKVWLRFNVVPDHKVAGTTSDGALAWLPGFSFDTYISSTGRWMSAEWFVGQTAILIFIFVFYYCHFHSSKAMTGQGG